MHESQNNRNHVVLAEPFEHCSTCQHAELNVQDVNLINCWGAPPVPIVLGGGQDALGRMALNVQVLRPVSIPRNGRACALHRPKPSIIS